MRHPLDDRRLRLLRLQRVSAGPTDADKILMPNRKRVPPTERTVELRDGRIKGEVSWYRADRG